MAKQSPKDPKFRCNVCKEYYYASDHPVHFQCPKHGYLCEKHVFNKQNLFVVAHTADNPNKENRDLEPQKDPFYDLPFDLPKKNEGNCKMTKDNDWDFKNYQRYFFKDIFRKSPYKKGIPLKIREILAEDFLKQTPEERQSNIQYGPCNSKLVKFIWNENVQRWLEEGRDKEEDFIKKQREMPKSIANNANAEIKLLVDLFEKDILDKSQFLEQLKSKL